MQWEKKYSDSDILNKITKLDYGELYYSVILRLDVDLRGANIIEKFVDEYEKLSTEGEKLINDKKNVCYRITVSEKKSTIIRERTLRVVDNSDFKVLGKETQFITKFIGGLKLLNDAKISEPNKIKFLDKALSLFKEAEAILPKESNDDEMKYNKYQVLNHKAVTLFDKHGIEKK